MRVNHGDGEECLDGQFQHDFFCVESSDTSKPGRWREMLRFRKQTKKTDEEIEDDEELGVQVPVTYGSLPLIMHLYIHTK